MPRSITPLRRNSSIRGAATATDNVVQSVSESIFLYTSLMASGIGKTSDRGSVTIMAATVETATSSTTAIGLALPGLKLLSGMAGSAFAAASFPLKSIYANTGTIGAI